MYSMRNRRRLFTIILILLCLIYFNWLVLINEDVPGNVTIDNNNNNNNKNEFVKKKVKLIYEVFENYEYIQANKNNKDRFILLSANNQYFSKKANKEFEINDDDSKLSTNELINIFRLFSKNEVFLLDIEILKDLEFTESTEPKLFSGYKYKVKNFLNTSHINFGIKFQSFSNFNRDLISKLNSKCRYFQMNGNYLNEKILTNLYIDCKQIKFQISKLALLTDYYFNFLSDANFG